MKKVAIMLDGGFVKRKLLKSMNQHPIAEDVYSFALTCIDNNKEELFRIYYYDSVPFGGEIVNPISGEKIEYTERRDYDPRRRFVREISEHEQIAWRGGSVNFNGWKIKEEKIGEIIQRKRALRPDDFIPDFKQKMVDMKIGLDISWLSSKNVVDRIILVTGDSDFVPAMKFARREGLQVVLVSLGHQVNRALYKHADFLRDVKLPTVVREVETHEDVEAEAGEGSEKT